MIAGITQWREAVCSGTMNIPNSDSEGLCSGKMIALKRVNVDLGKLRDDVRSGMFCEKSLGHLILLRGASEQILSTPGWKQKGFVLEAL